MHSYESYADSTSMHHCHPLDFIAQFCKRTYCYVRRKEIENQFRVAFAQALTDTD